MPEGISGAELDAALRAYAVEALGVLRGLRGSGDDIASRIKAVYWQHFDELQRLPSYASADVLLRTSPGLLRDAALHPSGAVPPVIENLLRGVLAPLVLFCCDERWEIEEPKLMATLDDAKLYLIDGKRRATKEVFLRGVTVSQTTTLGGGRLRLATDSDRKRLQSMLIDWHGEFRTPQLVEESLTVFEQSDVVPLEQLQARMKTMDRVADAAVTFLRVHVEQATTAILKGSSSGRLWSVHYQHPNGVGERLGFPSTVVDPSLDARAAADFATIQDPPPALALALRRFGMTSDYMNPDYILDLTIILEALFSDDDKQELTHKLALRVANFAASDFTGRSEIFKLIKKGYTARSKISHGRSLPDELRGIDERVAVIVRRALGQYFAIVQRERIATVAQERQIIQRLDEMCLGGPPLG